MEGWLIGRGTGGKLAQAIPLAMVANILSAWFGFLAVKVLGYILLLKMLPEGLAGVKWLPYILFAAMFAITLVIEFPLMLGARNKVSVARFGWVFFRAQLVTNAPLVLLLGWGLGKFPIGGALLENSPHFLEPVAATVYYLKQDGSEVLARRLDTGEVCTERILASGPAAELGVQRNGDAWEIVCYDSAGEKTLEEPIVTVPVGYPYRVAPPRQERDRLVDWTGKYSWRILMWPDMIKWKSRLILGNSFYHLNTERATILPTDQMIFSVKEGYLFAYDGDTRQLAIMAPGRSPVVVTDDARPIR